MTILLAIKIKKTVMVVKPGAWQPAASMPSFLKSLLSMKSVCVYVCVHTPQAMKDHSREMKPGQLFH